MSVPWPRHSTRARSPSRALVALALTLAPGAVLAAPEAVSLTDTASTSTASASGVLTSTAPAGRPVPPDSVYDVHVPGERRRAPVPPRDRSVSGSVVSGARLRGAGVEAADVLRAEPGVQVTESGGFGGPATAAIRGATAADTPIYLGGVRLNDDVGGTADLSLVPLWMIERVEIYRGNAPLEADRQSPGGAIFFEPRRPDGTAIAVGGMAGSFGAGRAWSYAGLALSPISLLLGASAESADNRYEFHDDRGTLFATDDDRTGRRTNADVATLDGWALARAELGGGATLELVANGVRRTQGVPRLALLPSRQARSRTERLLASVVARVPLGADGQHLLESTTSAIVTRAGYADPLLELALRHPEVDLSARRLEETLSATLVLGDALTLRPTISIADERIRRSPDDVPLDRARRLFARAAAGAELRPLEALTLRLLASGECHATSRGEGGACDVLAPTGRAGVEVTLGRVSLFANLARYARVPTLGELHGVAGAVRGNADLEPESGLTAELGARAETSHGTTLRWLYADAFAFVRAADALIAYRRSGQGYVVPYNVGRARILGAELLAGAALFSFLRAELSATLLDPRDTSPGRTTANDVLPYRSRLVLSPRITAETAVAGHPPLERVRAELAYNHQSSRYADPAGLAVIGAQGSLDLLVESTWLEGRLAAKARATNLFDIPRTDIVGYPLAGRSFYFMLEATW